jgi:hypothetical protein
MLVLIGGAGCPPQPPTEKPTAESIKIGDIAPKAGAARKPQFLTTAAIDVHTFDLPAENVGKLDDLWEILSTKSIWMTSYNAFRQNSFRVRSGRIEAWQRIADLLTKAGAQRIGTSTLMVNDTDPTDWSIMSSPSPGTISFADESLLRQEVNLGAGRLVLRLRTEPIPGVRGVRRLIAYPAHSLPVSSGIPELQAQIKQNEFTFSAAAFAAQMGPGDLLVLAPTEYTGERLTLGGLFFNKPEPVTFIDATTRQFVKQGPAVRILVLVCMGIKD